MAETTLTRRLYHAAPLVLCCALLFGAAGTGRAAELRPAGMPADAVQLSPCIPGMGEHWANPKSLPLGPYYGVDKGKLVFTELMISQKAFESGKSFDDVLKPLPGLRIDHVDVDFNPHGHHGYPIPHYDVHAYYVPHAVHLAYCTKP